jgi:hypothetical protein
MMQKVEEEIGISHSIDVVVVMRVTRTTGMKLKMRNIGSVLIESGDTSYYHNTRQSASLPVQC